MKSVLNRKQAATAAFLIFCGGLASAAEAPAPSSVALKQALTTATQSMTWADGRQPSLAGLAQVGSLRDVDLPEPDLRASPVTSAALVLPRDPAPVAVPDVVPAKAPSMFARAGAAASAAYGRTEEVVSQALGHLGLKYRMGGTSRVTGFDCSGLVSTVFKHAAGVLLPRTSAAQASVGEPVAKEDLKAGDLVFFNTRGPAFSHVGIYIGEGKFVHAANKRAGVRVDRLDAGYYAKRFQRARAVLE